MKVFISTVILLWALGLAYILYANKPETRKKKPTSSVPLVEAVVLQKSSENIHLEAYGTVIPARTLELRTEVDGRVVQLNSDLKYRQLPGDSERGIVSVVIGTCLKSTAVHDTVV